MPAAATALRKSRRCMEVPPPVNDFAACGSAFIAKPEAAKMGATGFEPVALLPQSEAVQQDAKTAAQPLAHFLAHEIEIEPDLARLIDAWPTLAPTVKRMILAALEAGG